jgi:hypothetical protein
MEMDYEALKRCCENLKEKNWRFKKGLQEFRVFKLVVVIITFDASITIVVIVAHGFSSYM